MKQRLGGPCRRRVPFVCSSAIDRSLHEHGIDLLLLIRPANSRAIAAASGVNRGSL
jgi:hypothetical protein